MTLQEQLIMVVGIANSTGMYLNIIGNRYGWLVVLIAQGFFGTYLINTHQWTGAAQFLCFGMACYGFYRWTMRGVHADRTGTTTIVAPIVNGMPVFAAGNLPRGLADTLNETVKKFAERHTMPEAA